MLLMHACNTLKWLDFRFAESVNCSYLTFAPERWIMTESTQARVDCDIDPYFFCKF